METQLKYKTHNLSLEIHSDLGSTWYDIGLEHTFYDCVKVDINFESSVQQIDMIKLFDGAQGSVQHAALSFEAVIRPHLILYHRRECC